MVWQYLNDLSHELIHIAFIIFLYVQSENLIYNETKSLSYTWN